MAPTGHPRRSPRPRPAGRHDPQPGRRLSRPLRPGCAAGAGIHVDESAGPRDIGDAVLAVLEDPSYRLNLGPVFGCPPGPVVDEWTWRSEWPTLLTSGGCAPGPRPVR